MKYYSTNNKAHQISFQEAVFSGLPPDGGLYVPIHIPKLSKDFLKNLSSYSFSEIAFEIAKVLLENDIPEIDIKKIVTASFPFSAPLKKLDDNIFTLELFHGPTYAFKDFGARFLSQVLFYYTKKLHKKMTILVATSGDTGSAVASAFLNMPNITVVLLYPKGKVSYIQEQQLTTIGKNIKAVEIDGTFDDCQRFVKEAFMDKKLSEKLGFTSANSINIARLLAQVFYYFYACAQLPKNNLPVVFSVPSGNLGNLTAGLIAKKMGLPVKKFIAATNANDAFVRYLKTGTFAPRLSQQTISNAMDVGNPSNFIRLEHMYNKSELNELVFSKRFSDEETKQAMQEVYQKYNYIMDPHGAIGYLGLMMYMKEINDPINGIFLETAHPGKFYDIVEKILSHAITLPKPLLEIMKVKKQVKELNAEFKKFKEYLLSL